MCRIYDDRVDQLYVVRYNTEQMIDFKGSEDPTGPTCGAIVGWDCHMSTYLKLRSTLGVADIVV